MMIIGLTGGIASGKSTVAAMLKESLIPVVDADEFARELTKKGSPVLSEIVAEFGTGILTDDHELDRRKLGRIVFNDKNRLQKLEAILHPKIESMRQQLMENLSKKGHEIVVYMAPLIYEKNIHKNLTKTLLITADLNAVTNRLKARDNLSNNEIESRISAQLSNHDKIQLADEILENNGTIDDLYKKLSRVWIKLTGKALPTHAN